MSLESRIDDLEGMVGTLAYALRQRPPAPAMPDAQRVDALLNVDHDLEVEAGGVGSSGVLSSRMATDFYELIFHRFRPVVDDDGLTVKISPGRWERSGGHHDFPVSPSVGSPSQPFIVAVLALSAKGVPISGEVRARSTPPADEEWYTQRLICWLDYDSNPKSASYGKIERFTRYQYGDIIDSWVWFLDNGDLTYDPNAKDIRFATRIAVATYVDSSSGQSVKGIYQWYREVDLTWGRGVISPEKGPELVVAIEECPEETPA